MPPSLFAFNLSQHQGLFNELALCNRWPNYWSFSFSTTVSNEYSGVIYFRINWFNFLSVQGILRSFLQYHNSNVSILLLSAFFMVQFSQSHMATGKTIALIIQTLFCGGGASKITADGDCSHEIKRHLLLGRKAMTNLDSVGF